MNHFIVSASLSSFFSLLAAAVMWMLAPSSKAHKVAAVYWFSISFWAFFVGSQVHTIQRLSPFWWGWFLHLGCTFIPVLMFHFAVVFTGQKSQAVRLGLMAGYVITVAFNLLNLWTNVFTSDTVYRDAYAYPKPALLYPAYFVLFVALVAWGTILLIRHLPALSEAKRSALKLFLVTHVLAYTGGMDNFLIMADIRIPPLYPFGLYLIPPYALAAIYVASWHRLLQTA